MSPRVRGVSASKRFCRYVATMLSAGVWRFIIGISSSLAASTARAWFAGSNLRSTSPMRFSKRVSATFIGTPNLLSMSACIAITS